MSTSTDAVRATRENLLSRMEAIIDPAVEENRALTDAEDSEWRKANAELKQIDARIAELAATEQRNADAEKVLLAHDGRSTGHEARRSAVTSLLPSDEALTEMFEALGENRSVRVPTGGQVETRAAITTTTSGAGTLAVQAGPRAREPRRLAVAAGLPTQEVSGVEQVSFPVFGAGDAGIAAEGALKTEYDNVTALARAPQLISIWTDVTRQTVLTMQTFEAKLRSVLSSKVARREDQLLIGEVLGTVGLPSTLSTPVTPDSILKAAADVAAGEVAAEPNLVVVNPAEVPTLLGSGVGSGGTASPPFDEFLPTIHGMVVYPSGFVAADEAIVGAWPAGSSLAVGLGPTFLVDAVSQIKNNLVTILLEEAVNILVEEPTAFMRVTGAVA